MHRWPHWWMGLERSRSWGGQSQFTQVTPRVILWPLLYISSRWLGQEWEEWQICPSGCPPESGDQRDFHAPQSGVWPTPLGSYYTWQLPLWAAHRGSHVKVATCKWALMVSKRRWSVIPNSVETGGRHIGSGQKTRQQGKEFNIEPKESVNESQSRST